MSRPRKLFGTDGIRGRANLYPMTGEIMLELGRAVAMAFQLSPREAGERRVLIGKDTRRSGYMLEDALAAGLASMGVHVLQVGPMSTPGLAFLTTDMRCEAGAMISASHNAFEDNGVKFFSRDGFKLPDEMEAKIEALMYSDELKAQRPVGAEVGRAHRIDDASGRYIVFLKKTFPKELSLEGLRIVVDCAHGAAYKVAPTVLEELGAQVVPIAASPNGTNINEGCGALHPQFVAQAVRRHRADLGVALDGDADRVIFSDENGEIVNGDRVLAMCALDLQRSGTLARETVVGTIMCNLGLELALKRAGIQLLRTDVGDRYVVEAMRREQLNLGGEPSGHVIFLDHNTTGDGMLTALQVLAMMRRSERPLSSLAAVMEPVPQVLRAVTVREKPPLEELSGVQAALQRIQRDLRGRGRINVRYSGTEPVVRVMIEGEDRARIEELARDICAEIAKVIGEEGT
ncbi:MAG: phosphoglucosamine mutase [Myxococcales bacterium]|nr:phosphoglucosamine mutase [Myxococcales bacterium]TDI97366.1 MAG: phosphoglucosamine mutase [Deltaproteobacteria bacterium]